MWGLWGHNLFQYKIRRGLTLWSVWDFSLIGLSQWDGTLEVIGGNPEPAIWVFDTTVLEKGCWGKKGGLGPGAEILGSMSALMPQTRNLTLAKVAWQVIARMEC